MKFTGYTWRKCAGCWRKYMFIQCRACLGFLSMAKEEALQDGFILQHLYINKTFSPVLWIETETGVWKQVNKSWSWMVKEMPCTYLHSSSEFSPQGLVSDSASRSLPWSRSGWMFTMTKFLIWKTQLLWAIITPIQRRKNEFRIFKTFISKVESGLS